MQRCHAIAYYSPDMQLQQLSKISCAGPSLTGIWPYYNSIPLLRMPAPFLAVQQDTAPGEWNLKCENECTCLEKVKSKIYLFIYSFIKKECLFQSVRETTEQNQLNC